MDDAERKMTDEIESRREKLLKGTLEPSIVVPVNHSITARQKVLTGDQVREMMDQREPIALTECGCRATLGKCDAPLDVCIAIGPTAEMLADGDRYTVIPKEEALAILERTAETGLVHLTLWEEGHVPYAICSCCSCCCHELLAMSMFGYDDTVIASDYVAVHDVDSCSGCGNCVDRCHFGAFTGGDGGVVHSTGDCFGCGVCVPTCPEGAISLVERG